MGADEVPRFHSRSRFVLAVITDDSGRFIRMVRMNDVTKGILVHNNAAKPILKDRIFKKSAPAANTNIFTTDLLPLFNPSIFRITAAVSAKNPKLNVVLTDGADEIVAALNNFNNLKNVTMYDFDVMVDTAESFNLRFGNSGFTILRAAVYEVPGIF